jgi:hypothetical protein
MSIQLKCSYCNSICQKTHISRAKKCKRVFCSVGCHNKYKNEFQTIIKNCSWCGKSVKRFKSQLHTNVFCNRSCATSHRNKHRPKLNSIYKQIEECLLSVSHQLKIVPSDYFDIFVKSINLAFDFKPKNNRSSIVQFCLDNHIKYYVIGKQPSIDLIKVIVQKTLDEV